MEILLEQRFKFAKISLLKNYCKLEDKRLYRNSGDHLWSENVIVPIDLSNYSRKRKQTAYFTEPTNDTGLNNSYASFQRAIHHYTTSDKQIVKNYNNPFADITIEIYERTIRRNGSKILLTTSRYTKHRAYNCRYFRSYNEKSIFSFDFKTGNFQTIRINQTNKNNKKAQKIFRTNNFEFLLNIIKDTPGIFDICKLKSDSKFKFVKEINEVLNDMEYREMIGKIFDIDSFISLKKLNTNEYFYDKIQEKFINTRKIKVPNYSYEHLLLYHYPKEKYLKKNDRKLIASILDMYGIKSKYTIKLLHIHPRIDIYMLVMLCHVFGKNFQKYISSINDEVYINSQAKVNTGYSENYGYNKQLKGIIETYGVSDDDKEKVVKVINGLMRGKVLDRHVVNDIIDHFRMINTIRTYDPSIKMKAKTPKEFDVEHRELSKIIAAINRGWVIEYLYDEKTTLQVEEPIKTYIIDEEQTLYPHILKREEEYVEEGNFMHHCVASYADKEKSIIVSIRTENESDRVTCEFDIQSGIMIQARHFCNAKPPEFFDETIEIVQDKIRLLARFGTLNWKEKRKVPVMINGVEVKPSGPTLPF